MGIEHPNLLPILLVNHEQNITMDLRTTIDYLDKMTNLFIHHRDYRLTDNTTLHKMFKKTQGNLQPIFIFTPTQIDPEKNKYRSNVLVEFLCHSLLELDQAYQEYSNHQIKLQCF